MRLKTLTNKDLLFVHKLRNHPEIVKSSHLQEGKIIVYNKKKIGYIIRKKGFISIAILPEYQNQGIGTKALEKFCRKGDKAEILSFNLPSMYLFKKMGFVPQYTIYVKE